jgi:hypothetical protein
MVPYLLTRKLPKTFKSGIDDVGGSDYVTIAFPFSVNHHLRDVFGSRLFFF